MKDSDMLTPAEVSEKYNVGLKTLYTWDKEGILVAHRIPSPTGKKSRKLYSVEQLEEFWNNIKQERLDRIERAKNSAKKKNTEK